MSGIKWLIDQYFQLPRWERIGNILLLAFILITIGIISLWPEKEMSDAERKQLDKLEASLEKQKPEFAYTEKKKYKNHSKHSYKKNFYSDTSSAFISDLSTTTVNQLQKAGLNKKTAFSLHKYLQKGGKIRSEKDVRKIYGMTDQMASAFLKNIKLEIATDTSTTKPNNKNTFGPREKTLVNLNTADSATMVFVDGISPKMIPYILKFRQSVGGFYSVEQLNEVFKSPLKNFDHIKPQVTVEGFKPFIKINSITVEELKKYKYFKKDNLASTLIAYRDKHGKFTKPEDLKKSVIVTDDILKKIEPYLIFD